MEREHDIVGVRSLITQANTDKRPDLRKLAITTRDRMLKEGEK
jgi:hypothetical protein